MLKATIIFITILFVIPIYAAEQPSGSGNPSAAENQNTDIDSGSDPKLMKTWFIGAKSGFGYSRFNELGNAGWALKSWAYDFGITIMKTVDVKQFAIINIGYQSLGSKYSQSDPGTISLKYVNFSVIYGYRYRFFYAGGGLFMALLTKGSYLDNTVKTEYKPLDIGMALSAGVIFDIKNFGFVFGIDGKISFSNVHKNSEAVKAKNVAVIFYFAIGYAFL